MRFVYNVIRVDLPQALFFTSGGGSRIKSNADFIMPLSRVVSRLVAPFRYQADEYWEVFYDFYSSLIFSFLLPPPSRNFSRARTGIRIHRPTRIWSIMSSLTALYIVVLLRPKALRASFTLIAILFDSIATSNTKNA